MNSPADLRNFVSGFIAFKDQLMTHLNSDKEYFQRIRLSSDEEIVELAKTEPQVIRFMAGFISLQQTAELVQAVLDRREANNESEQDA